MSETENTVRERYIISTVIALGTPREHTVYFVQSHSRVHSEWSHLRNMARVWFDLDACHADALAMALGMKDHPAPLNVERLDDDLPAEPVRVAPTSGHVIQ